MIERRARCDGCGTTRPLAELLIIHDRHDASREPWYCCRSSAATQWGDCLQRAAGAADRYSIALADPDAEAGPIRHHPRHSEPSHPPPRGYPQGPTTSVLPSATCDFVAESVSRITFRGDR